jgi:Mrp family chromosome partitioning ATPase
MAATVAVNLAAAAAREARAVLLVDLDQRHRLVASMLRVADRRGMSEVLSGDAEVLEVLRDYAVGRDVYMTVLYGGQRAPRTVTAERRMVVHEDLERLASRYDLTVIVGDESVTAGGALLPTGDVILCTRIGVTPNSWLSHSAHQVRAGGQRVRAVLTRARTHALAKR